MSDFEDTNKVLLDHTRETTARIHHSPNLYDSSHANERPTFATPISDRTITENSASVKFTCSVLSTECDISWEKNGFPIRPSSKYRQTFSDGLAILELYDVIDSDAGKYNCIASNKHGETVTSAKLKVYSGFKPSVSMPPSVSRQMKGRDQWRGILTLLPLTASSCISLFTKLYIFPQFSFIIQLTLCLFAHDCNTIIRLLLFFSFECSIFHFCF